MKKSIWVLQFTEFIFVSIGGTLLHFLYEWSGESIFTAPFSGVNESTWEHMKLIYFPLFIFAIIEYFFLKDNKSFWCIKLKGTLAGLCLIPIIFYLYNGVIGNSPDFINIAIFFISAAVALIYEAKLFKNEKAQCHSPITAFIALCFIGGLFVIFTFNTPKLAIFKDPISGGYGVMR